MIISIGSGFGLKKIIKKEILDLESHIQITSFDKNIKPIYLENGVLSKIKEIQDIYPIIYKPSVISSEKNIEGIILKGIPSTY